MKSEGEMKSTDYKTFKKEMLKDSEVRKEYDKLKFEAKQIKLTCSSCGADANLCKIIRGRIYCQKCINEGKVKRRMPLVSL